MTLNLALIACALLWAPTMATAQSTPKTVDTVQTPARQTVGGAPSLLIPPSSIGIDLCLGEDSGAYGSSMLAITLSMAQRDAVCSLLRQSKWAADLGRPELAYQIMCASADWRAADGRTLKLCR